MDIRRPLRLKRHAEEQQPDRPSVASFKPNILLALAKLNFACVNSRGSPMQAGGLVASRVADRGPETGTVEETPSRHPLLYTITKRHSYHRLFVFVEQNHCHSSFDSFIL
jgi:hypothetical protein